MTRIRLVSCIVLLLAMGVFRTPGHAIAAGEVIESNPADGVTLDALPEQVALTFDGAFDPESVQIVVIGPNGARADTGMPETTANNTRSIGLRTGLADGSYQVHWLIAVPGTRASVFGDLSFTVEGATPCQPPSNATPRPPAEKCVEDPMVGGPDEPIASNGMIVTLSVSGDQAGPVDLQATVTDDAGNPIEDAVVWFRARHLEMDHGEFPYLAATSEAGVYQASGVGMGMGGDWRIAVDIIVPDELPVTVFVEQTMVE